MVGVFPPRCPTLHPFGLSPHCPILHVFVISTSCCTKFMLPNMSPLGPYFIVFCKERLSLTCSVRTPQKEGCLQWPWCFNNSNKGGTRSPVAAEMISGILSSSQHLHKETPCKKTTERSIGARFHHFPQVNSRTYGCPMLSAWGQA